MNINIGSDFCITPPYLQMNFFNKGIIDLFEESDLNIINLECPITIDNKSDMILKTGPHLRTDDRIFRHLKLLNIHAVTLANNHILDFGDNGLNDTINKCINNNILVVGSGLNSDEASRPLYFEIGNIKVAFVNFCENEWSIATPNTGGANPLELIDNITQLKNAKKHADFVIVIVHGGHEYYELPSPRMVKQYRFFVDNGADAVIGHHTHCISGYEVYRNVPIVYSLGNMLFTLDSTIKEWYYGLIAQLRVEKNKPIQLRLIPIKQLQHSFSLWLLEGIEKDNILMNIAHLNSIINNPVSLEIEWGKFIENNRKSLYLFSPTNLIPGRYLRAALNRLGFNNIFLNKRYLAAILNQIRCEAHRDVIIGLLERKI